MIGIATLAGLPPGWMIWPILFQLRICVFLMLGSNFLLKLNWRSSLKIVFRDAWKHPSPNGGWPESSVAGALGIRLGGWNSYGGVVSFRSYLGDATRPFELADIERTIRILNVTVIIALCITGLIALAGFVGWGIIF